MDLVIFSGFISILPPLSFSISSLHPPAPTVYFTVYFASNHQFGQFIAANFSIHFIPSTTSIHPSIRPSIPFCSPFCLCIIFDVVLNALHIAFTSQCPLTTLKIVFIIGPNNAIMQPNLLPPLLFHN